MTTTRPYVLVADEDRPACVYVADNLAADGYRTASATDAAAASGLLDETIDALVVDVNGNTLELVRAIRAGEHTGVDPQVAILALTSHQDETHRVRLLEHGADDVLVKPYGYFELRARLGALVRRLHAGRAPERLRAGQLAADPAARRVWIGDREMLGVREKEYQLLLALLADPSRVFTRTELLQSVWELPAGVATRTLDAHAARLRARLQGGPERYVVNVWGVGYRLLDTTHRSV